MMMRMYEHLSGNIAFLSKYFMKIDVVMFAFPSKVSSSKLQLTSGTFV